MVISFRRLRSIACAKAWRSFGIVERRLIHVPLQEIPAADRDRLQHDTGAFLDRQHVGRRELIDIVDLSGQQALHTDDRSGEVLHDDELCFRRYIDIDPSLDGKSRRRQVPADGTCPSSPLTKSLRHDSFALNSAY